MKKKKHDHEKISLINKKFTHTNFFAIKKFVKCNHISHFNSAIV